MAVAYSLCVRGGLSLVPELIADLGLVEISFNVVSVNLSEIHAFVERAALVPPYNFVQMVRKTAEH
jgi:hypothetical protein